MVRRIALCLVLVSFGVVFLGVGGQGVATVQASGGLTATSGPFMEPTCSPGFQPPSQLFLNLRDSGGTFTIPVGTLILLQVPRLPFARLIYDPAILELLPDWPPPCGDGRPPMTPQPPDIAFRESGWRLRAIQSGVTALAVEFEPCRLPPCPMLPAYNFRVTLIVGQPPYPTNPPPVVTPYRSEKYIGTAYLNQTVGVEVGQVVVLDLPFLTSQRPVQLRYDARMLQPLPGQSLNYLPPQGWHFWVVQPGTSTLTVLGSPCPGADCGGGLLFQVTITTAPQ